MPDTSVIKAVMGMDFDVSKLQRELKRAFSDIPLISADQQRVLTKTIKDFETRFHNVVEDSLKAGLDVSKLHREFESIGGRLMETQTRIAETIALLERGNLQEQQRSQMAATLQELEVRRDALMERVETEMQANETLIRRKKDAAAYIENLQDKGAAERMDDMASGIEGIFSDVQQLNLAGLGKKIGEGFVETGKRLEARGVGEGAGGRGMAGAGRAISAIGKAAVGIAAAVGIIAAVVKGLIDADNQAKELNAALMQGGASANFFFGAGVAGAEKMEEELNIARRAAIDFSNNLEWMTTPKEQVEIIAAFNEGNTQLSRMIGNLGTAEEKMKAYNDATAVALTYSRLFGTTASEMATTLSDFMDEQALGLGEMGESFRQVLGAAQVSGFNIKRFYSTVLEATSGLGYYNVRLEEAAYLLKTVSGVLGKTKGAELVKDLSKGFADMSYQERIKKVIISGGKDVADIMDRSAQNTATALMGKKGFMSALARTSLGAVGDPDTLVKKLGAMGERQVQDVQAEMLKAGATPELVQQFRNVADLARGAAGGTGDMAKAMASVDMGGKLALMLQTLGDKPLSELSAVQRAAFESYAGISGEQLETLVRLDAGLRGNFRSLERTQKAIQSGDQKFNKDEAIKQAKAFGAYVDENGKIIKAMFDEQGNVLLDQKESNKQELKNLNDFIQANGDQLEEAIEAPASAQEILAKRIAKSTESVSKIMEMSIAVLLEGILSAVNSIVDWIFGGEDSRQARMDARNQIEAERQNARNQIDAFDEKIGDLKDKLLKTTDKAKRAEIQNSIDTAEASRKLFADKLEGLAEESRALNTITEKYGSAAEFRGAAQARAGVGATPEGIVALMGPLFDKLKGPEGVAGGMAAGVLGAAALPPQTAIEMGDAARTFFEGSEAFKEALPPDKIAGIIKTAQAAADAIEQQGGTVKEMGDEFAAKIGVGLAQALPAGFSPEAVLDEQIRAQERQAEDFAEAMKAPEAAVPELTDEELVADAMAKAEEPLMKELEALEKLTGDEAKEDRKHLEGKGAEAIGEETAKALQTARLKALAAGAGLTARQTERLLSGRTISPDVYSKLLASVQGNAAVLTQLGVKGTVPPPVTPADFIVTDRGIIRPHPDDVIFGAKPGGPIMGAAGGGGTTNMTFNISGGDERKVFNTVTKALRAAKLIE